jgi:hypothetical protein
MAPGGHVPEPEEEEPRRDPGGIVHYVEPRKISVLCSSGFIVIAVEAENAAIVNVPPGEQHGVVEEERG